jgi:hypothetical protein
MCITEMAHNKYFTKIIVFVSSLYTGINLNTTGSAWGTLLAYFTSFLFYGHGKDFYPATEEGRLRVHW